MFQTVAVPFQYPRLKKPAIQLRLLSIQPDDETSRLVAKLETYYIGETPPYVALSYTWGDPLPTKSATIRRQSVRLRYNCWHALWQARSQYPNSLIWADRLCIDQRNLEEKSIQVRMMGSIFADADLVVACIGPHFDDSPFACRVIQCLEATNSVEMSSTTEHKLYVSATPAYPCPDERRLPFQRKWRIVVKDFGSMDRLGRAMDGLGWRSFWKRLWIVQEIRLARRLEILCGDSKIDWESFFLLLGETQKYWRSLDRRELSALTMFEFRHRELLSPTQLLPVLKTFQCSDSRDLIFGSLEVVAWSQQVPVDYSLTRLELAAAVIAAWDDDTTTYRAKLKILSDLLDLEPNDPNVVLPREGIEQRVWNLMSWTHWHRALAG